MRPAGPVWINLGDFRDPDWWLYSNTADHPEIVIRPELMRQINLYRESHHGKVVVVSPDDSYAEVLATQGVLFLKYEP